VGWDWVHLVLRPLIAYCTAPDHRWWWLWSNLWNEDWQGKPKYSEKTCRSATSSTTNPTWPEPGSNPGRRGGKPAINRLSYGTTLWGSQSQLSKNAVRFPFDLEKVRNLHGPMWSSTHHLNDVGLQIAIFFISLIYITSYALPVLCIYVYMEIIETRIKPTENISYILKNIVSLKTNVKGGNIQT
jgi:hypothetical protein